MATLSTLTCVTGAKNTGIGACSFEPKNIVGAFLCPPNYVIPAAQMGTGLLAQMVNDTEADSKSARIFPIGNFLDFKDASEQPVVETFGYGAKITVRDGTMAFELRFARGGQTLLNRLRSFNGSNFWFLFVDSKNQLIGTSALDGTGAPCIGAFPPIEFYAKPAMLNDGKKNTEYWLSFSFLPKYINELLAWISDPGFDFVSSVNGLQDVNLTGLADVTSGTYYVTPLAGDAKTNLTALYPTAIVNTAIWTVTNATSGAAIVPTTVSLGTGANAGMVKFVLPTVAPPYPTTGKVNFNLVGPTELATALIPGYESAGLVGITKN